MKKSYLTLHLDEKGFLGIYVAYIPSKLAKAYNE